MPYANSGIFSSEPPRFRRSIGMLVGFWTVAVAVVLTCEWIDEYNHAEELLHGVRGV